MPQQNLFETLRFPAATGLTISAASTQSSRAPLNAPVTRRGRAPDLVGAINRLMIGAADVLWDAVAIAEYPSREAFAGMMMSAEYQAIAHHRLAGLEGQLDTQLRGVRRHA